MDELSRRSIDYKAINLLQLEQFDKQHSDYFRKAIKDQLNIQWRTCIVIDGKAFDRISCMKMMANGKFKDMLDEAGIHNLDFDSDLEELEEVDSQDEG